MICPGPHKGLRVDPCLEFCGCSPVPPTCTSHWVIPLSGPSSLLSPLVATLTRLHLGTPGCHSREAGPGPGCSWGSWRDKEGKPSSPSTSLPCPPLPLPAPTCHQGSPPPAGLSHPGSHVLVWKRPTGSGAGGAVLPPAGPPGKTGRKKSRVTVAPGTLPPLPGHTPGPRTVVRSAPSTPTPFSQGLDQR